MHGAWEGLSRSMYVCMHARAWTGKADGMICC